MEFWIVFALITAFAQAAVPLINEYFKVRSIHLLFWMRVMTSIALLPVVLFVPWPDNPLFYVFTLASALIFAYADIIYVGLAATIGAGVVSRIEPLSVGLTFLLWLVVAPMMISDYLDQPLRGGGIIFAFVGSLYFALRLQNCTLSREALRRLLPMIILVAFGVVSAKMAMDSSPTFSGVIYYALIQSVFVLVVYILALNIKPLAIRFEGLGHSISLKDKRVLLAGFCMGVNWMIGVPSKQYAFSLVENPAYVTLIALTSPLWVLAVYRLVGRREEADVKSGLGLVICAAALVVFTQL